MKTKTPLFCIIILLIFTLSVSAYAKSFTIPHSFVSINISGDGLVTVSEKITAVFSGSFSFGYLDINLKTPEEIINYQVLDENRNVLPSEHLYERSYERIKWYFNAENSERTFTVKYAIRGVIKKYDDFAEFYWQVWGNQWDSKVDNLEGEINLPGNVENTGDVYTWGHPSLNGRIGMTGKNKIVFQAFNIPKKSFVEIRILFPSSLIKENYNSLRIPKNGLEDVIKEEKSYSSFSNKLYGFSKNILRLTGSYWLIIAFAIIFILPSYVIKYLFRKFGGQEISVNASFYIFIFFILIPIFIVSAGTYSGHLIEVFLPAILIICFMSLLFVVLYILGGREPGIEYDAIYERDVPYNYSPALLKPLLDMSSKYPSSGDFVAEFLNLCYLGYFKLEAIKKKKFLGIFGKGTDYLVIPNRKKYTDGLSESQKIVNDMFYDEIADDKESASFSDIVKSLSSTPISTREKFERWRKKVREEAESMGFFDKSYHTIYDIALWTLFGLIVLNLFFISRSFLLFTALVIGFMFSFMLKMLLKNALPRRTKKGALHAARWLNLKKFLSDNSALREMPPTAIDLWERFLIYAIPLGVAREVQKEMKIKFENSDQKYTSGIFVGSAAYSSVNLNNFNSMVTSFSSAVASSSSTGGSSGFSGGGGGGSGGGGGGFG